MLNGPDQDEVRRVSQLVGGKTLLYSGGIGTLDDLRALAHLGLSNLTGVIVGKALYEQRFGIGEAQAALDGTEVSTSP
jgi:phosphoribosylformimino-5-aminoimidazole carboxamide ribotide isomerase